MSNFIEETQKKIDATHINETIFSATFNQEKQIVSALNMVGAGFEARGGSTLMLTEAVENGVDAIIKFNQNRKNKVNGTIRAIIDVPNQLVMIIDNGTGFLQIKHVCEKPFDSLKEFDNTQTGKFARGLQGFRAFCNNLTYITQRLNEDVPFDESEYINSRSTNSNPLVKLDFISTSSQVKVKYVENNDYNEFLADGHGTIAIYENWKPGEFDKFNINMLFKRLQHHFGELIRNGEVSIVVEWRRGKIADIGPEQIQIVDVEPKDYSDLTPLEISPIKFDKDGKQGEISLKLFLSDKGQANRWNHPFLLYHGRPVGDGFISEIDEFSEHPIWNHKLLTGYITCDFCEINELRQGLKINNERDFLFKELLKLEKLLENKVKEHSKGLYELKLQKQVTELVKDLQLFFKAKNIFNFKMARSNGFLSKENDEIEIVEIAKTTGTDASIEVLNESGEETKTSNTDFFVSTDVQKQPNGTEKIYNSNENGLHDGKKSTIKQGGPSDNATAEIADNSTIEKGLKHSENNTERPSDEINCYEPGGKDKTKKKGLRHKPKGFGMVFQDDEFNEDLSWFDDVNSVVIINSQHPRFLARQQDETQFKSLMNYLAELYILEITKLVYAKDDEIQKITKFLDFKFEYLEKMRQDEREGRFANE